ncbi:hypothetical protein QAD02_014537 [Eretmocerus hayati]|uniref:Uncharacterized protein n=1 Tax=Eretmocerus hayati TaxID=131215 RepID=A0ACC2PAH1_9HYME|nr:hypothetical protein QAD02_014537 [Eretmocerus hayati]
MEDQSLVKVIKGTTNENDETLILCAEKNHFPKIERLVKIVQDNENPLLILVQLLSRIGNHNGAFDLVTEEVEARKYELGPNNPSTLAADIEFAKILYIEEKYPEAD